MAYQIKRAEHITEELELLAPDDTVEMRICIEVSPETIAKNYRRVLLEITKAQQACDMESFETAVHALFQLVFGENITQQILCYFKGSHIDAAIQVLPFMFDCISPAVDRYVKSRRAMAANNAALNHRQRRALGL